MLLSLTCISVCATGVTVIQVCVFVHVLHCRSVPMHVICVFDVFELPILFPLSLPRSLTLSHVNTWQADSLVGKIPIAASKGAAADSAQSAQ